MGRAGGVLAGALLGMACVIACGGSEEAPQATGARMSDAVEPAPAAAEEGAGNHPPRIERVRLRPERPRPGEPIRAVVEASDPDGDPVQLDYRWSVNGSPRNATGAELRLTGVERGDRVEVTVVASDGRLESRPARARTRLGNRPPRITRVWLEPVGEIPAGTPVTAVADARDEDGDPLEFEFTWIVNGSERPGEESLSTESLKRGDRLQVRVVASDGKERSEPATSPPYTLANGAPRITSKPAGVDAGGVFRYTVEARDPDGDRPLRFRLARAPEGMQIDPLGEITWQPSPDQVGRHPVEIVVEDGHGGRTAQRFELILGDEGASAPAAPEQ